MASLHDQLVKLIKKQKQLSDEFNAFLTHPTVRSASTRTPALCHARSLAHTLLTSICVSGWT